MPTPGDTPAVQYQTTRIWKKSLDNARQLHKLTGENMVTIIDRLLADELARYRAARKSGRRLTRKDKVADDGR